MPERNIVPTAASQIKREPPPTTEDPPMRGMDHHPVIALLSLVVLIAGCSISVASLAPGP